MNSSNRSKQLRVGPIRAAELLEACGRRLGLVLLPLVFAWLCRPGAICGRAACVCLNSSSDRRFGDCRDYCSSAKNLNFLPSRCSCFPCCWSSRQVLRPHWRPMNCLRLCFESPVTLCRLLGHFVRQNQSGCLKCLRIWTVVWRILIAVARWTWGLRRGPPKT